MCADILKLPRAQVDFSPGCLLMGVLNVTPDSFSDGGKWLDTDKAVKRGLQMSEQGAAVIDVGPESSRPGSEPVDPDQQIRRAIPVIEQLTDRCRTAISIDTRIVEVAKQAVKAGASIINDITAASDEGMIKLAAETGCAIVLMHMRGCPQTMQHNPVYGDVVLEVKDYLVRRAEKCEAAGIPADKIFIDPGIGFGKTTEHNLSLLRHVRQFVQTGFKVLIGTSRKRFIGRLTGKDVPEQRVLGTAATVAWCAAHGVSLARVHDIPEMLETVKVANAIKGP